MKINNRLKLTIAYTYFTVDDNSIRELHFAKFFFSDYTEEEQKQLLLHEIAHCILVEHKLNTGHTFTFKQICKEIGCIAPLGAYTDAEKQRIKKG